MEFASRGARLLVVASAGLLLSTLASGACRRRPPPRPPARTATLEGSLRDKAGRAVPGASVLALPQADAGARAGAPRRARTSDGGTFRFEDVPRGRYTLVVDVLGLGAIEPAPVEVPGPPVDLRLRESVRWLDGQVVDGAGQPANGARVLLGGTGGRLTREAIADVRGGFFSFAVLEAGAYALRARHGTLVSPTFIPAADLKGGIVLTLGPGSFIAGQVVDDAGAGVGGVEVRAEAGDDDPLPEVTTARADGGFRLGPLPPGRVRVVASAPGHLLRAPVSVDLADGKAPPPQRLVLVRGASLSGRVVDARGAAVAGAEVRCVGAGPRTDLADLAVLDGVLPLAAEAAASPGTAGRAVGTTKTARSDERGAFRLQDLLPGPLRLEVSRPPFAPLAVDLGTVAPGAARDVGALVLRDAAPVAGRVLDEKGAPVAGARVAVSPQIGVFAQTDGAGAFTLALPPGSYTLTASAAGRSPATATVNVAGSAAPPPVELRLAGAGGALDGLAQDSAHRPLARASVRAFAAQAHTGAPLAVAMTDAGGHFKLARLPAGALWIEVDRAPYPMTGAAAAVGTTLEVVVPVPGGVDGEVREHVTGAPVARARVEAAGPAGQRVSGVSGKTGTFKLLRLRPGRWTLTVSAPGFRTATKEVDVPAAEILGETSVRGVRIEVDAAR
jgi:hypothetical protein